MTDDMKATLQQARDTYGARNQISVAIEELCELATALSKFVRYEHEDNGVAKTREKVLDEYADVCIVLEHVQKIYGFTPEEEHTAMRAKVDRLKRWLQTTSSLEYTTVDRTVQRMEQLNGAPLNDDPDKHTEKWWCHNCDMPVEVDVEDPTCPACRQGLYFKGPQHEAVEHE